MTFFFHPRVDEKKSVWSLHFRIITARKNTNPSYGMEMSIHMHVQTRGSLTGKANVHRLGNDFFRTFVRVNEFCFTVKNKWVCVKTFCLPIFPHRVTSDSFCTDPIRSRKIRIKNRGFPDSKCIQLTVWKLLLYLYFFRLLHLPCKDTPWNLYPC